MDTESFKTCYKCKQAKPHDAFHRSRNRPDGLYCYCANCHNANGRQLDQRRREERERLKGPQDPSRKDCPCCGQLKLLEEFYTSRWTLTGRNSHCKECIRTKSKQRYRDDPKFRAKLITKRHRGYAKERAEGRNTSREWALRNPERHKEQVRRRNIKRVSTLVGHLQYRVLALMRRSILRRVADKSVATPWEAILGYTFDQLKGHIEHHFKEGMSWDLLRERKIEIDHVIPRAAFYYETVLDPDFKTCWALDNLRPEWSKDNRIKGDKMPDGTSGRELGRRKQDHYELRLAAMAAGASEPPPLLV